MDHYSKLRDICNSKFETDLITLEFRKKEEIDENYCLKLPYGRGSFFEGRLPRKIDYTYFCDYVFRDEDTDDGNKIILIMAPMNDVQIEEIKKNDFICFGSFYSKIEKYEILFFSDNREMKTLFLLCGQKCENE